MSIASDKLAKARAGLVLDMPFFGSLALRLTLTEDPGFETAWTDGKELGYNPAWIESLELDEVKGVLCHEVMHCATHHHTRREDRDKAKWNVACDLAINPLIVDCGLKLPQGGLMDTQFRNMEAEKIYNMLPDDGSDKGGQDGSGNGKGKGGDPGVCGAVRDAKGDGDKPASSSEKRKAEQEWNVSVNQAATQAKAMGELPGALERLVKEIVDPKLDWRDLLKRFVDSVARNDYSWFPPNRRFIHSGIILPSLRSDELERVVVSIDTSGSIRQDELDQFAGEMTAILNEYNADCTVIYCDAQVQEVEEVGAYDLPLSLSPKGGGGTDFRPPFRYLEEKADEPACMIYFTDGQCSSFPEIPAYPVLWAVTSEMEFTPPFGEVVHL